MTEVNYRAMYDEYWCRPDRKGQDAYDDDLEGLTQNVLALCKSSRVLDVGCGMGKFVRALLDVGVDAHGVDVSHVAVEMGNDWGPGRFTMGSLTDRLPFDDSEFDTVVCTDVLEHIHEDHLPTALSELRRVAGAHLFVTLSTAQDRDGIWHLTVRDRAWWHDQFLQAGMRTHPLSSQVISSKAWRTETWRATFLLEKIPNDALLADPLNALRAERDLHMDMTREIGSRSEAHVERYNVAASFVREGDVVLDAACGLGYGAQAIYAFGRAKEVVGVDVSEGSILYATRQFATDDGVLRFEVVDLAAPLPYPDASFDVVASFETLEHLPNPELFLSEVNRILRPGGRVIVSVPNDWTDETGKDPNPYHFHVYDWQKIFDQISREFVVDMAFSQIAGGGMKLTDHPRSLSRVAVDSLPGVEAEWWLLVGVKSPLNGTAIPYIDHSFAASTSGNLPKIVDFAQFYENPWLVKSLIVIGWRFNNPTELRLLAEAVLHAGNASSADRGGALCVHSYMALSSMPSVNELDDILERINVYCEETTNSANPHVRRWRISLQYVAGRLNGAAGRFAKAEENYQKCIELGTTLPFALLATKTCDASRRLGMIALNRGLNSAAEAHFNRCIELAMSSLQSLNGYETWGYPDHYLIFGFDEMKEIIGIAKRCSELVHELRKRRLDTARYGLPDLRFRTIDPTVSELIHTVRTLRNEITRMNSVLGWQQKADVEGGPAKFFDSMQQTVLERNTAINALTEIERQLARARARPMKVLRDYLKFKALSLIATRTWLVPETMAARFAKSARKRDPERSTRGFNSRSESVINNQNLVHSFVHAGLAIPELSRRTILVVSHEASRTGAPIVALNLARALASRYNVVVLTLRGGNILDAFQDTSLEVHVADQFYHDGSAYTAMIQDLCRRHDFAFAIVNSLESRGVLKGLNAQKVPIVTLVHEFVAYTRPKTSFLDVVRWSTEVTFSTQVTLENALQENPILGNPEFHVEPQGKCVVPAGAQSAMHRDTERTWLTGALRPQTAAPRQFVVIGAGHVQVRKGVDLFIEVATRVLRQPEGAHVRFAWIGSGYDPERDTGYSVYLRDQLRRAGIEDRVQMLRETSEIELAYDLADAFLLSSRLDPLPNVAIDALSAGLPVLCFDRATGIADCLRDGGLAGECVASYIDTTEMAYKLLALAASEALRADLSARSRTFAQRAFDFPAYATRIEALALAAELKLKSAV